jgi:hypothetical protein
MMGSAHQLLGEAGIVHPIRLAHVTFLDIAQRASKKACGEPRRNHGFASRNAKNGVRKSSHLMI